MLVRRTWIAVLFIIVILLFAGGANNSNAGSPLGLPFVVSDESEEETGPAVAYNSERQEYLVVWWNDRPGNDDIRAERVSKDGKRLGGFWISTGAGAERRNPDVVYNSQEKEYLVVWQHEDATSLKIHGQRVSATGGLEGGEIIIGPLSGLEIGYLPAVAYASTVNKYLVVWEGNVQGNVALDVVGQVLSGSGAHEGSQLAIAQGTWSIDHENPDVAYNRSRNEYLVVWQWEDKNSGDHDIHARRVQGNGTPMLPESITIAAWSLDQIDPAVTAIPTSPDQGQYLVVWEHVASVNDTDIWGQRVSGAGGLEGSAIDVTLTVEDEITPAVAGNERSQEYLVTWTEAHGWSNIHARAVSLGGGPSEPAILAGVYADNTTVTSGSLGDFLVVYDDKPSTPNRNVYGYLWGNRVYLPLIVR